MQQALDQETENVMLGLPALRDKKVSAAEYREILIKQTEQKIINYKEWYDVAKADAQRLGITVEESVRNHATYTVDEQIRQGKIMLPETDTIHE